MNTFNIDGIDGLVQIASKIVFRLDFPRLGVATLKNSNEQTQVDASNKRQRLQNILKHGKFGSSTCVFHFQRMQFSNSSVSNGFCFKGSSNLIQGPRFESQYASGFLSCEDPVRVGLQPNLKFPNLFLKEPDLCMFKPMSIGFKDRNRCAYKHV